MATIRRYGEVFNEAVREDREGISLALIELAKMWIVNSKLDNFFKGIFSECTRCSIS